jgi:hypothetical protein
MREVVAKRIIDIAQRGVEDQEALVTGAFDLYLTTTNNQGS